MLFVLCKILLKLIYFAVRVELAFMFNYVITQKTRFDS
jgi:hypothetical protein